MNFMASCTLLNCYIRSSCPVIMKSFIEFLQNAYYHCLHYLENKKLNWFERLFWAFWVILSMVAVVYIVVQSVHHYYHTKATIRLRTDYLDFKTPFPSIFFCENQEIREKIPKMLEEFNYTFDRRSKANVENFVRTATFIRPMGRYPSFPSCGRDEEACRFMATFRNNLSAFGTYIRATCEEIFTSCTYNGKEFDCCEDFLPVDTFEGKCFAINSFNAISVEKPNQIARNKPLNTSTFLKYTTEHKPDKNPANLSVELDHTNLYVWYIGNTYLPTKMYQKDNQFEAMEKYYRFLDVYLRVQETLPDKSVYDIELERRICRFWYENETMRSLKVYSISGCEMDCLRTAQLLYCGCVLHLLSNQNDLKDPLCDINGVVCTAKSTEIVKYLSSNCTCVSSCTFLEVFPVGFVTNTKARSNESFRNPRSKRRINFLVTAPTVQYWLHAKEEALDFIVNIGGAISLCIGCSFLILAQIIYYFSLKPLNDHLNRKGQAKILKNNVKIEKAILRQHRKIKLIELEENIRNQAAMKRATLRRF